jgi:hypothetical protein
MQSRIFVSVSSAKKANFTKCNADSNCNNNLNDHSPGKTFVQLLFESGGDIRFALMEELAAART